MVDHHDPVGEGHGLGLVVGDVDHGGVETVAKPRDLQAHPHSERGVEVGERLVEQKDLRVADDGPPDGHALALPAGELARVAPEQRLDLKGLGNLGHTPGNLGLRDPGQPQPESDVLRRRHVGEQGVGLEHHRHPAPRRGDVRHVVPSDQDAPGGRALQPRDHPQHGGLAAPRGTDKNHELAVRDLQIDAVDGDHRAEALRNAIQGKLCHRQPFTAPIVIPLMK